MYKLKKEFLNQEVVVYTPGNRVIKLDSATQEEFEIALKIKGNEKFIDVDKRFKSENKEEKKETKKPVEKKKAK